MRGFSSTQLVTLAPASKGDGSMSRRGFDARVLLNSARLMSGGETANGRACMCTYGLHTIDT